MTANQELPDTPQAPAKPKIKRTFYITEELWNLTTILAHKKPYNGSQSAVIQAALRAFIDQQDDIIGSRAHFHKSQRDFLTQIRNETFERLDKLFLDLTKLLLNGNPYPHSEAETDTPANSASLDQGTLLRAIHTLLQLQLLIFPPILKRMGVPDELATQQNLLAKAMSQAHHYSLITEAQQDYIESLSEPAEPTPENMNARA